MNDFTVTVEHHPHHISIIVDGELDLQTCPDLEETTLVIPLGGKTLRLELSGVSFMDFSGLNLLLRLRLHTEGGRLVISALQDQPTDLLCLTETYELLTAGSASATAGSPQQTPARV